MIDLRQGDCLELMKDIPNESIDFVLTDPPYGIDYQSSRRLKAQRKSKIANDKAPFIWFVPQITRILKMGGGGVHIQQMECAGHVYSGV